MQPTLKIGGTNSSVLAIWRGAIGDNPNVQFIQTDERGLLHLPNLDALLVPGRFAHERYGGHPRPGESQLIDTGTKSGLPRWLITKAPFEGHVGQRVQPDGTVTEVIIVNHQELEPEQEAYILLVKAFQRVAKANLELESKIKTFAFHIDQIHSRYANYEKEAKIAIRAWLEFGWE